MKARRQCIEEREDIKYRKNINIKQNFILSENILHTERKIFFRNNKKKKTVEFVITRCALQEVGVTWEKEKSSQLKTWECKKK